MDNNCCLPTPLYWIPKIYFIPTDCNICKIKLIVYQKVIALYSTTTERKGICIIIFSIYWLWIESPKAGCLGPAIPYPTYSFLYQKAR